MSSVSTRLIDEMEIAYPSGKMLGVLPCYGFYLRHVHGIRFHGVTIRARQPDARPPVAIEDVRGLYAEGPGALSAALRRLCGDKAHDKE
jgi:hypothetical protein